MPKQAPDFRKTRLAERVVQLLTAPSTCPICSMYGIFTCIWSFGCNSRIILGCIESKIYDAEDSGRWGFEQKVYGVRWPALSKGGPFCIMHPVCYSLSLSSGRVWKSMENRRFIMVYHHFPIKVAIRTYICLIFRPLWTGTAAVWNVRGWAFDHDDASPWILAMALGCEDVWRGPSFIKSLQNGQWCWFYL
jgi:hypothetical protein